MYQTDFSDDAMFQLFTKAAKSMALYDTGVEVTNSDSCVTLSTCTGASDWRKSAGRRAGVRGN